MAHLRDQRRLCNRVLGRLLHWANSQPPAPPFRERFYWLKGRLIKRYGNLRGYQVQHIQGKTCFRCGGSGHDPYEETDEWWEDGERHSSDWCERCGGTGWYRHPVWVLLVKHRLGAHSFHTPIRRQYSADPPDWTDLGSPIEGYIEHPDYPPPRTRGALLLLALRYDPGLAWDWMRSYVHTAVAPWRHRLRYRCQQAWLRARYLWCRLTRQLMVLDQDAVLAVPRSVAVCPYCEASLQVELLGWSLADDGSWIVGEIDVTCTTEPSEEDPHSREWVGAHSVHPYEHWLPMQETVVGWMRERFRVNELPF